MQLPTLWGVDSVNVRSGFPGKPIKACLAKMIQVWAVLHGDPLKKSANPEVHNSHSEPNISQDHREHNAC